MKTLSLRTMAFCLGAALLIGTAGQVLAQTPADTGAQPGAQTAAAKNPVRYDGRVTMVSKDASTVTVQAKSGTIQVKYTDKTKFTYRNKPGTADDVQQGRRVIVLLDPKEKDMVAARIDVREGK